LAAAVRAVARLPRAVALVLAGALMGGEVARAVREIREKGIIVLSLNMPGSVPDAADTQTRSQALSEGFRRNPFPWVRRKESYMAGTYTGAILAASNPIMALSLLGGARWLKDVSGGFEGP
jgi:hypothetical protein